MGAPSSSSWRAGELTGLGQEEAAPAMPANPRSSLQLVSQAQIPGALSEGPLASGQLPKRKGQPRRHPTPSLTYASS